MVDLGKSDKMIKVSGKVDKSTVSIDSVIFHSLLKKGLPDELF